MRLVKLKCTENQYLQVHGNSKLSHFQISITASSGLNDISRSDLYPSAIQMHKVVFCVPQNLHAVISSSIFFTRTVHDALLLY